MTSFYNIANVNNHILDGASYLWWPNVFPGDEFVSVLNN